MKNFGFESLKTSVISSNPSLKFIGVIIALILEVA